MNEGQALLDLFISTPNALYSLHGDRGHRIPNPSRSSAEDLLMYNFVGVLMGVAAVSHAPLPMDLPLYVWKKIGGEGCSLEDFTRDIDSLSWLSVDPPEDSLDGTFVSFLVIHLLD